MFPHNWEPTVHSDSIYSHSEVIPNDSTMVSELHSEWFSIVKNKVFILGLNPFSFRMLLHSFGIHSKCFCILNKMFLLPESVIILSWFQNDFALFETKFFVASKSVLILHGSAFVLDLFQMVSHYSKQNIRSV